MYDYNDFLGLSFYGGIYDYGMADYGFPEYGGYATYDSMEYATDTILSVNDYQQSVYDSTNAAWDEYFTS